MFEFSFLNAAAVIVTLAALFGYINHRWLGLPHAIGIVVIALLASLGAIAIDAIFPALALQEAVRPILANIDFHDVLMMTRRFTNAATTRTSRASEFQEELLRMTVMLEEPESTN